MKKIPPEVKDLIERGRKYFPDVNPSLFLQPEEWQLYFALIFCKEEQDECLSREDYLGALMVVSKLTNKN